MKTVKFVCFLLAVLPQVLSAQLSRDRPEGRINNWTAPREVRRAQIQASQVRAPQLQQAGSVAGDQLVFVPVQPCRLADTRANSGYPGLGSTPMVHFVPRTLPILGSCGITNTAFAEAYSFYVTVVPAGGTPGGYLLAYPDPISPWPLASSLDWNPNGVYQTGAVVVPASADGSVNFVVDNPTDVVVDINGYYAPPTDGRSDTALGLGALSENVAGSDNTAFGTGALLANVNGSANTGVGYASLYSSGGSDNTAIGYAALYSSTGNNNIAVGASAGSSLSAGNRNILIGNQGVSTDDHVIRIGDLQTSAYIAGIWGNSISNGANVFIGSNGQLGIQPSSRRYKEDIQDMGDLSKNLLRLRPVTFRYKKPDPGGSKPLQFGLIAEEVAEVYPELVFRAKDGQVEGVEYSKLPAMLLNELQRQHRHAEQQDETIRRLEARLAAIEAQLSKMPAEKAASLPCADKLNTTP